MKTRNNRKSDSLFVVALPLTSPYEDRTVIGLFYPPLEWLQQVLLIMTGFKKQSMKRKKKASAQEIDWSVFYRAGGVRSVTVKTDDFVLVNEDVLRNVLADVSDVEMYRGFSIPQHAFDTIQRHKNAPPACFVSPEVTVSYDDVVVEIADGSSDAHDFGIRLGIEYIKRVIKRYETHVRKQKASSKKAVSARRA